MIHGPTNPKRYNALTYMSMLKGNSYTKLMNIVKLDFLKTAVLQTFQNTLTPKRNCCICLVD